MVRTINSFAGIYWFYEQIYRLGRGEAANLKALPLMSMANVMLNELGIEGKRKKLRKLTPPSTADEILAARRLNRRDTARA